MIVLQVKTRNGDITDIPVEELLSVDGKPYGADCSDRLTYLEGRLDQLERMIVHEQPAVVNYTGG